MLADFLRFVGKRNGLDNVRFEKKARDIALETSCSPLFFDSLLLTKDELIAFLNCSDEFGSLFFEEDFAYLLWISKCMHVKGSSLLSLMNSYICAIHDKKRGGLNTYKRIGWDVHVLYVCQLTSYNFANGIPPVAYSWNFNVQYAFNYFMEMYTSLSKSARFVLKIGSFLHDIGVTLSVKDHEDKGVPLTDNYYMELGVSDSFLTTNEIELNTDEIICLTRAIVGNHQIINQISAEASDKYIYEKISRIRDSFAFSAHLLKMFEEEFIDVMFLLAAADMMAVDDSLLSPVKFEELIEARSFLKRIITTDDFKRDYQKYGIKRLISLLPDSKKGNAEKIISSYANSHENKKEIYEFLYDIKFISYGMAAIKPLNDTLKSIKLIDWCNHIVRNEKGSFSEFVIKFNPDIDTMKLGHILDLDIGEIIEQRKIQYTYLKTEGVFSVTC